MPELTPPPADITPTEFFESWLPAQYATLRGTTTETPPKVTIGITLEGDGGGSWKLETGESLSVTPGSGDGAIMTRQSVADWRVLLGAGDGVALPAGDGIAKALFDPATLQTIQGVNGAFELRIDGVEGRTWSLEIVLGGATEPRAIIATDAATLADVKSGALPAPQAYFSGKIRMEGDVALAMQLGMALMARAS